MVEKFIRVLNNEQGTEDLRNYVTSKIQYKYDYNIEFWAMINEVLLIEMDIREKYIPAAVNVEFLDDYKNIKLSISSPKRIVSFESKQLCANYDEFYNGTKANIGKYIKLPFYDDYVTDFANAIYPTLECDIDENGIENCSYYQSGHKQNCTINLFLSR